MVRRRFAFAGMAVLAAIGLLGATGSRSSAEELGTAAGASVSAATGAGVVGGPVGDVGAIAPAGDCVGGACAGAYGGGGGPFGLHPITCLPGDPFNPHLFYNFYVGGNCGSMPAGMYPSPMPTPPLVGHTYYTYQPLLPHEFMYAHYRVYHHHYNYNRGLHRTRVVWAW